MKKGIMQRIIYENKIFEEFENDIIKSYRPLSELKEGEPEMTWKGGLLPDSIIQECLSFFRDVDKQFSGEGQVRLFYNKDIKEWKAWAFPQECLGLSTKELDENVDEDLKMIGKGFRSLGTIHSHCSIAASQSGTDHTDEIRQDGIHITIGNIDKEEYSIHCRFVFYGVSYEASIENWIKNPEWLNSVPKEIRDSTFEKYLTNMSGSSYPKRWIDNVRKKNYTIFNEKKVDKIGKKDEDMETIVYSIREWYHTDVDELRKIWSNRYSKNIKDEMDEMVEGEIRAMLKEFMLTEVDFVEFLDEYSFNKRPVITADEKNYADDWTSYGY